MRTCPDCKNNTVIEDGYCGTCRQCTLRPEAARPKPGGVREQRMVGWLTVPTEPEPCWIPLGMKEEDFELLEASLKLWRSRIIVQPEQPANGGDSRQEPRQ